MDTINKNLPEPKLNILNNVKFRKQKKQEKKEKPQKYLDLLFKQNDLFLKKYFQEK